jgi:hypothetical protein
MSSILDALKKLEEEKAARTAKPEEEPFEPERAGESLFGRDPATRSGGGVSPMALFVGGGIFTLLVACISVVAVLWYTRPAPADTPAPTVLAANTPEAAAPDTEEVPPGTDRDTAVIVPAPVVEDAAPQPTVEDPPATEVTHVATAVADPAPVSPEPEPEPQPEPRPEPEVSIAPRPAPVQQPTQPAPAAVATPAVVVTPPAVEAPPATPSPTRSTPSDAEPAAAKGTPLPRDLSTLPPLRASDEVRYGLENITINGIREPNANRPYGVAYINMDRVYVNEVIPGTRARIVGLDLRGIAIEIVGSGERFYVRHGRL